MGYTKGPTSALGASQKTLIRRLAEVFLYKGKDYCSFIVLVRNLWQLIQVSRLVYIEKVLVMNDIILATNIPQA